MSTRALAIQRNPTLFKRARGYNVQRDADASGAHHIVHEGDEAALQAYIAANRSELEATVAAMHKRAKDIERGIDFDIPYSNAEWLVWLEANDARFRDGLRCATDRRRGVAGRLQPMPGGLPEAPRVVATPPWVNKVAASPPGFFGVRWAEEGGRSRCVICFACCYRRETWGFVLPAIARLTYLADHRHLLSE